MPPSETDRRAIAVGAAGGTLATVALLEAGVGLEALVLGVLTASAAVAGATAGVCSRNFENEFVDGAAAAFGGLLLSLAVLVVRIWLGTARLPLDVRVDFVYITLVYGLFGVLAGGSIVGAVGALSAHFAASIRRGVVA